MGFQSGFWSVIIYFMTFLISVACIYCAEKEGGRKKLYNVVGIFVPAVTAAFRKGKGDFITYQLMHKYIRQGDNYPIEPFWYILNRSIPTYENLLFIAAFIFCGISLFAICKFLKKGRWLAWLIFLLVCYGAFYNLMRQMLAVSIVFVGIYYMLQKKYGVFLIFVILACGFHKSALFMVVVPCYMYVIKKIKNRELLLAISTILAVICLPIIGFILNKMGLYTNYLNKASGNVSLGFLFYTIPPLFFYYKRKKMCDKDELLNKCMSLHLLVIPFQTLGMFVEFADRIMLYFQILICAVVPQIINSYDLKVKKHSLRAIYVLWFIFHYIVIFIMLRGSGTYPYRVDF